MNFSLAIQERPMKPLQRVSLRSTTRCLVLGTLIFSPSLAWPVDLTIPNTFVPGKPASATEVNTNFTAAQTAVNSKQNRVVGTCPSGSAVNAVNADGSVGCQQLSFFGGDGSGGNLTISASTDWTVTPPVNLNFANVTINPGQTLTVPAGTAIRCSGTFTNNGILTVATGAKMGGLNNFSFGAAVDVYSIGHPGDSLRPASGGSYDIASTHFIQAGIGGDAIPRTTAMTSFNSFRIGGGSGAGWRDFGRDGDGGGLVKIYCTGNVANAGTINAVGGTPSLLSGGGGGGIVVLASASSVASTGTINANGGSGGPSFSFGGAGGGGGGGIVIFVAPTIGAQGTINVAGGGGGSVATQVSSGLGRYGGGGGGASGGAGGTGSSIGAGGTVTAGTPTSGSAGYVLNVVGNPVFLLH
jgi:hypothetical protein